MTMSSLRRLARKARRIARRPVPVTPKPPGEPTLKSALMEEAALARGYGVTRLDARIILVEAPDRVIPFQDMNGPESSVVGRRLCDHKFYARQLLAANGLHVVASILAWSVREARQFVKRVGYPVVVKPVDLARGKGVTTDVASDRSLRAALVHARLGRKPVVVERQFEGDDFRFFVIGDRVFSATSRVRANVVGDGVSSVKSLIERKNGLRRQNRYLEGYLIPLEIAELTALRRAGKSLAYVPGAGERVHLRDQSNLSAGGDSIDVTDACHPSFKEVAVRSVSAIPGMTYAGVDILARSIREEATAENHVVGEVEYSPAPIANFPVMGSPRDMAAAILEYYEGRIRASG